MRSILFIIVLVAYTQLTFSQSCLPEGIAFYTQDQIDHFPVNYPGCTEIQGSVTISGILLDNVDSLYVLTAIGGELFIHDNHSLTNLNGLENLTTIGTNLTIIWNDALTSFSGLQNLTSIGGSFNIRYNELITNMQGLNNLTTVGMFLTIQEQSNLVSLGGLESLNFVGESLQIISNSSLTNLTGLNNLTSIGDRLIIWGDSSLTSLAGIDGLVTIGGDLWLVLNSSLNNLSGLRNLTSIGGEIMVSQNDLLSSLSGLDNIDTATIERLNIHYNPMLTDCAIESVCDYLASPEAVVDILDNATGCDTREQVDSACVYLYADQSAITVLTSKVYPNPFDSRLSFEFDLPKADTVEIVIMDGSGRFVSHVLKRKLERGSHHITWNASQLIPGIYIYHIKTGSRTQSGKIILTR